MKGERIIELTGAFDRRNPDPKKNYGIHGMELRFVLKGERGAVGFTVYTPMHLPHVADELWEKQGGGYNRFQSMGADIGYHSPTPRYEGHTVCYEDCPYLNGVPCYVDGSTLSAEEFMPAFLAGGSEVVWPMLEQRYVEWFGDAEELNRTPNRTPEAGREAKASTSSLQLVVAKDLASKHPEPLVGFEPTTASVLGTPQTPQIAQNQALQLPDSDQNAPEQAVSRTDIEPQSNPETRAT